jgi:hypothetical protein
MVSLCWLVRSIEVCRRVLCRVSSNTIYILLGKVIMKMQYKFRKYTVLALIVGAFWATNAMSALCPIVDLGARGGTASVADGINDRGQVIGRNPTGKTNDLNRGFVWKRV